MIKNTLLFICIVFYFQTHAQSIYYFSSSSGADNNSGIEESSPFKTMGKLNSLNLSEGDKVLFKRGDTFIGQIIIAHSGSENAPIIYDSYGSGELPILTASNGENGTSDAMSTIKIVGKEYLEFHNLHIENERFDPKQGADNDKSFGIYITSYLTLPESKDFEERDLFKHFRFSNLHFENIYSINSNNTTFNSIRTSGIYFLDAFVNDVIIEDCSFTDIERTGVWLRKYLSDVIIRNNSFIDIGGSGTIISVSKRVLYQNNLMRFTGSNRDERMTGRGSGMWVFGSDDVVAQYNTSQHARGAGDSSGMHVDYGNSNILFQYNYLEDSAGGFCETLGKNINVIWRYNISVNEGTDDRNGKDNLLWVSAFAGDNKTIKSDNVYIYNNTIYQGTDYKNALGNSKISLKANDISFLNNIIFLESEARLGEKSYIFDVNLPLFKNNIMFGGVFKSDFKNLDATKVELDPKFVAPGRTHLSGYKISSLSPAKGTAFSFTEPVFPLAGVGVFKDITSKATKDIFGNPVDLLSASNIGADNGSGESIKPVLTSYEAESATMLGGTEINCQNASEGLAVKVTEEGSLLTFDNISVSETATYLIKVFYLNPILSNLELSVNGGEYETIVLPYSDGFCYQGGNPTSFHFVRTLNSGSNTIKFSKSIIDKIEVVSLNSAVLGLGIDYTTDKTESYLVKTIISSSEDVQLILKNKDINSKNPLEVSIFDITGRLLIKQKFQTNNIIVPANKLGKGLKIVTAKIGAELIVKKIVVN